MISCLTYINYKTISSSFVFVMTDSSSIPINNKPLPKSVNPVQSPRTGSGPGAAVVQEHQGTVSEGSAPPASGHERFDLFCILKAFYYSNHSFIYHL